MQMAVIINIVAYAYGIIFFRRNKKFNRKDERFLKKEKFTEGL